MRKFKNLLLVAIAIVIAFPFINGCKKGENDPFLSLSSRKARLTAEWKLTEMEMTCNDAGTISTYAYNGTTMTYTSGSYTSTSTYSETITIEKDGTYTQETTTSSEGYTSTSKEDGAWYFGQKSKELDQKGGEVVIFQTLSSTTTSTYGGNTTTTTESYTGSNSPTETFVIDKLASKEMIIILDGTSTTSTVHTTTGTATYEKQ